MSIFPVVIACMAILAMLLSVLLHHSERFREFWARHVCAFMEEHQANNKPKGGV